MPDRDWSCLHPPARVLKVSQWGFAMLADICEGGHLTERPVGESDGWSGRWAVESDQLTIDVGQYHLMTEAGSIRAIETGSQGGQSRFVVLPVITDLSQPLPPGQLAMAVKVFPDGRIYAAELLENGGVREFDLRLGSSVATWDGRWSRDGADFTISVGGYEWHAAFSEGEPSGDESGPDHYVSRVTGVLVTSHRSMTYAGIYEVTTDETLFEFGGFTFHSMPGSPNGFFGSVLEARRPSGHFYAAKLIRPTNRTVARREADIAKLVSSVGGLMPYFDFFELPDDERFGSYAGHSVQVLERGDRDLARRLGYSIALSVVDTLRVMSDVSGSLAALHGNFGLVHSDVKLENIIERSAGTNSVWRLADFNVATKISDGRHDAPFLGTTEMCKSPRSGSAPGRGRSNSSASRRCVGSRTCGYPVRNRTYFRPEENGRTG